MRGGVAWLSVTAAAAALLLMHACGGGGVVEATAPFPRDPQHPLLAVNIAMASTPRVGFYETCSTCTRAMLPDTQAQCRSLCSLNPRLQPFVTHVRVNISNIDDSRALFTCADADKRSTVALVTRVAFTGAAGYDVNVRCAAAATVLGTVAASNNYAVQLEPAVTLGSAYADDVAHVAHVQCLQRDEWLTYEVHVEMCASVDNGAHPPNSADVTVNAEIFVETGTCYDTLRINRTESSPANLPLAEHVASCYAHTSATLALAGGACDDCSTIVAADAATLSEAASSTSGSATTTSANASIEQLALLRPDVYETYNETASAVVEGVVVFVEPEIESALLGVQDACVAALAEPNLAKNEEADMTLYAQHVNTSCSRAFQSACVARRLSVWLLNVAPVSAADPSANAQPLSSYAPKRGLLRVEFERNAYDRNILDAVDVKERALLPGGSECGSLVLGKETDAAAPATVVQFDDSDGTESLRFLSSTHAVYERAFYNFYAARSFSASFVFTECTRQYIEYTVTAAAFTFDKDARNVSLAPTVCRARDYVEANHVRCWQRRTLTFANETDVGTRPVVGNLTCYEVATATVATQQFTTHLTLSRQVTFYIALALTLTIFVFVVARQIVARRTYLKGAAALKRGDVSVVLDGDAVGEGDEVQRIETLSDDDDDDDDDDESGEESPVDYDLDAEA